MLDLFEIQILITILHAIQKSVDNAIIMQIFGHSKTNTFNVDLSGVIDKFSSAKVGALLDYVRMFWKISHTHVNNVFQVSSVVPDVRSSSLNSIDAMRLAIDIVCRELVPSYVNRIPLKEVYTHHSLKTVTTACTTANKIFMLA